VSSPRTSQRPAKKTAPAKRTPAKKTTAAKKPALAKTTAAPSTGATVVDFRKPLPVRRRLFVGPHTHAQIVEARAVLASATARLPIPSLLWLAQADGRAGARLGDGTHLVHTHEREPEFTAVLRCPTGGLHTELVTNDEDLRAARAITRTCTRRHDDTDPAAGAYDWHKAITLGVQKLVPARLSPLNVGLQAAKKAAAKTQPLPEREIAAGLADRAADTETPKEHPQP
jgi:hypothetical protein